jgi:uncharacterized protein YbjT (DUF2867 family)
MKVFLAGATGAVGKRLVPMLVAAGHEVTGMTRTPEKASALLAAGAQPVVADVIGEAGLSMMNSIRGAVNSKAKRLLRWQPLYPNWREGFRRGLSARDTVVV